MTAFSVVFAPYLPLVVLLAATAVAVLALAWGVWRRARGIGWRVLFLALLLAALANPVLRREQREALDDIVLLVKDHSPSQRLQDRPEQAAKAEDEIRRQVAATPGLELREVDLAGDGRDGTTLFATLRQALAETDRSRLGAVVALTDGEVHDVPKDASAVPAPLHALLTGHKGETDRRITIEQAPSFTVVGEAQKLTVHVEDDAAGVGDVPVTLRQDGKVVAQAQVKPGTSQALTFTVRNEFFLIFVEVANPLFGARPNTAVIGYK